ncbi:hypothetical protein FQR65_LT16339 [Abscondita terminalis]|nr:hypothetical protein FQR65_LT16339 [Abscondita terminalis]
MLFARAISNGVKWYCPDVFSGPVYTPEELSMTIDTTYEEVSNDPVIIYEADQAVIDSIEACTTADQVKEIYKSIPKDLKYLYKDKVLSVGCVADKSIDNNQNLQKEKLHTLFNNHKPSIVKTGAFNAKRHDSDTTGMEKYSQRTEGKRSKSSKRTPKNSQHRRYPGQSYPCLDSWKDAKANDLTKSIIGFIKILDTKLSVSVLPAVYVHTQRENIHDEMDSFSNIKAKLNPLDFLVPQGVVLPEPESVFSIGGIPVFTKGSISTIAGLKKAGKTTVLAWIVAQCIKGNLNVLWIDTEQGKYYSSKTQFWLLTIGRTITPPERMELIGSALEMFSPDMVIIDGVRDVMYDINSTEETQIVITQLMKWSEVYNCHIVNILHFNKGKGNEVLRGHIGTEIQNKAETVIRVVKDDSGYIIVEPQDTRGEPFSPLAFQRDGYGIPILVDTVPVESGKRSIQATDYTLEQHSEY